MVDDSLTTRMLEQSILESAGYEVDLALSGEEALTRVRAKRYGVILVDVEMPGMDGFELASALRSNPRTADLPIIGLSSLVSPEAIERGKRVGLHDYVAKFDRPGLIAALKEQTADMSRAA